MVVSIGKEELSLVSTSVEFEVSEAQACQENQLTGFGKISTEAGDDRLHGQELGREDFGKNVGDLDKGAAQIERQFSST